MNSLYKKRDKLDEIIKYLNIPEIIVLHGARQVGKTTLIKMTMDYLKKQNIDKIFYFDLEKEEYLDLVNSGVDEVVAYIKSRSKMNQSKYGKTFIFIDEIQYLDNPSSLLKLFYDHHKNDFKLIVSGSSSFAIKSKFKDSLVGRIVDLEIFGLNFEEFLNFKDLDYDLSTKSELAIEEIKKEYKEYILYGFYPQIVLVESLELKELYLNNIIEKYIYKDIRDLAKIKDIEKFNNLLKFLASQCGQLINTSEISNTLNISRPTIEQYLFILENTYIIKTIRPFHKNIRSELSKMSKIYFEDLGVLNILRNKKLINNFDGIIFENSVYNYLRQKFNVKDINFWRTTSKQEIDFILNIKNLTPIEVKLKYRDKNMNNLLYFGVEYNIDNLYCLTYEKENDNKKNIKQLYPWEIKNNL